MPTAEEFSRYRQILGVRKNATPQELKDAFARRAEELTTAFAQLSDSAEKDALHNQGRQLIDWAEEALRSA